MRYRRNFVPGGSFFFTVVTENRRPILTSENSIPVLREAFRTVRLKYPFRMDAMVLLPNHLHCIWTLPSGDRDFSTRWRLIKTWFTKHSDPSLRITPNERRSARGEQALWQRRYWEHTLRDDEDYSRHVDYIHYNPVKHGYVAVAAAWPYSSIQRYIESGLYPEDWGGGCLDFKGVGSE